MSCDFLRGASALVVVGLASVAFGQNYEELVAENARLQAQLAALQAEHGDHEHGPAADAAHDDDHADEHAHQDHAHSHCESGRHGHENGHCNGHDHCHEHFDFCLPFEAHHGGHGDCDLCGCGGAHGNGHSGHGHNGHEHGPAYHHSIEGYPLLHPTVAHFEFIERHINLSLADVDGADDGEVDELEFETEITYALSDRVIVGIGAPLVSINPIDGENTTGFGDLELSVHMLAFNGPRDGVLFGLSATVPTGDPDRDLGEGNTVLEPHATWVHDFGCGTHMFNVVAFEIPIEVDEAENELHHDFVIAQCLVGTADAAFFRYLTPSFEVNTTSTINGPESGRTVVNFTTGMAWIVTDANEMSVGWSFPVSGDRDFDNQFIAHYVRHF